MLLNRRAMLQASIGAIALGMTGCNKTKTTVDIVNATAFPISLLLEANGQSLKKNNIPPGGTSKKSVKSNDLVGTKVPVTGNVTLKGKNPVKLKGLKVTLGKINTFVVSGQGKVTVFVA